MAPFDARKRLLRRLRKVHLDPTPDVVEGLLLYYELLYRWNEKINLTSLSDGDEAVDRLLVEPLLAARLLPDGAAVVLDVGSGGGSPAIPLKLAAPTVQLWMVEAKVRKSAFLREAVRQLSLTDVRVENGRHDEVIAQNGLFGMVDVVSVRGVRADLKLLASLQQFLRPDGQVFFFTTVGSAPKVPLPPQLTLLGETPLLSASQSALVILQKRHSLGHSAV